MRFVEITKPVVVVINLLNLNSGNVLFCDMFFSIAIADKTANLHSWTIAAAITTCTCCHAEQIGRTNLA